MTGSDISKGKGFVSDVLRCIIYFVDSNSESDTYTTILKIPGVQSTTIANENDEITLSTHNEKFVKKICDCHQIEIDFYEHLSKTLDIPTPRVFKTFPWNIGETEGLIQMEDMTGKGKIITIGNILTISQIKEIVRYLAHMHSRALTSEDQEFLHWKGKNDILMDDFQSMLKAINNPTGFLETCGNKGEWQLLYYSAVETCSVDSHYKIILLKVIFNFRLFRTFAQ